MDTVRLVPVSRANWEAIVNLQVQATQQDFVPTNCHSLVEAHYEGLEALAIYADKTVVGLLVLANWSGVFWISRIMVDAQYQSKGIGRLALQEALKLLAKRPDAYEVRTSIDRRNALAEYLFSTAGFQRKGDIDEHEFVMSMNIM